MKWEKDAKIIYKIENLLIIVFVTTNGGVIGKLNLAL